MAIALTACSSPEETRFRYDPVVDRVCSALLGPDIQDSWRSELESKLPRLEALWRTQGMALVDESATILGQPIDSAVRVQITLCNTPSRSFPLIVNLRYALRPFTANPVALAVKVGTLHHELLHRPVDERIPGDSALLAGLEEEHPRVRNHVHLLALQKATYLNLGLNAELEALIAADSALPNGYYRRAWAIVNASPTRYLEFLAELTDPDSSHLAR